MACVGNEHKITKLLWILKSSPSWMFHERLILFNISFQNTIIAMPGKSFERHQVNAILSACRDGTPT
jgi:hypothetical protein